MTSLRNVLASALLVTLSGWIAPSGSVAVVCGWSLHGSTVFNGAANANDWANALAVDASGNVIVVGVESSSVSDYDWRIIKYDPSLSTQLASTGFGSSGGWEDQATGVVVDGTGNIFVVGLEGRSSPGGQWLIRKYDSTLTTLISSTEYDGPFHAEARPYGIALDGFGNIIVVGYEVGAPGVVNWAVRKYDSTLTSLLSATNYNGPGNNTDIPYAVAVDGSGDIIVVGSEVGIGGVSDENWRIRKYDSTLTTLLSSTDYGGPANSGDAAQAVAVDGSGNVVVAGYEISSTSYGGNWRVRKYDTSLSVLLTTTAYTGPAGGSVASGVVVDAAGNVFVVGSDTTGSSSDWRINEYDPNLTTLQSSTNYGTYSEARAVVLDGSGYPIVAGFIGGWNDWLVEHYGPSPANLVSRVSFQTTSVSLGQAFSAILSVSNTGCGAALNLMPDLSRIAGGGNVVLVSGPSPGSTTYLGQGESFTFTWTYSATAVGVVNFSGTVTGWDPGLSATVMAASTGSVLIQTPAGLTGAIAVQPATVYPGDAVVVTLTVTKTGQADATGVRGSVTPILTGVSALKALGPSPAGPFTLSGTGSQAFTWVYTAGQTPGTLTFSVSASGADANAGFSLTTGMQTIGGVTIISPYEPCPSTLVTPDPDVVFDGPSNGYDEGNGIVLDPSGSIFIAAREDSENLARQGDGFIGLYPPGGGSFYSSYAFASVGSVEDYATGVAIAPGGLIYYSGVEGSAAWIGALTTAGAPVWSFAVPSPLGGISDARGVTADATGNLIVTGRQYASASGDMLWLAKYTSAGSLIWSSNDISVAVSSEAGYAVAVDPSGSIYVAGYETRSDLGQGRNIIVLKYSAGGAQIWKKSYDSAGHGTDEGRGIAVDAAGSVYACGFETRADLGQGENGWVRKYDRDGNVLWTNTFNSPLVSGGGPNDRANGIALAPNGDVYITGREERSGQGGVTILRRYDTNGLLLEVDLKNGPNPGADDHGSGVTVDPNGLVYVVSTEDWNNLGQQTNYVVHRWSRPGCITAALSIGPSTVSVGQTVTVVLTITNTGSSSVTTLVPGLSFPVGLFSLVTGPSPASVATLTVGSAATFTWTLSATGAGVFVLTGTGTGTESATSKTVTASASAAVTVQSTAHLVGRLTAPATACAGQIMTVMATVSNTGQAVATGVGVPDPLFLEGSGSAGLVPLSAPLGLTSIPGGGAISLTWTFSAPGSGVALFTATATGMDGNSGQTLTTGPFTSATTAFGSPALFISRADATQYVPVGGALFVVQSVTNTGLGGATVSIAAAVSPPGAPVTAPASPSGTLFLGPGVTMYAHADCFVTGWGVAVFTITVSGADSCGPVSTSATVLVELGAPASLAASGPTVLPDPACLGGPVTVTLAVTNTGDVPALNLAPALVPFGSGFALPISVPPSVTVLAGGAAVHLTWTFSATAAGDLGFTATVTASDGRSGAPISVDPLASGTITVTPSAILSASSAGPNSAIIGQWITLTLTVTNVGGQDATGVSATSFGTTPGLVLKTGPLPAGSITIPPGAAQTFSWTYSIAGAGSEGVALRANYQSGCNGPTSSTAIALVTTLRPAVLVLDSLTLTPAAAPASGVFSALAILRNAGDADLTVTGLTRTSTAGSTGGLGPPGPASPGLPLALAGGTSVYVAWTYTGTAPCGIFGLKFTATGYEDATGRALTTGVATAANVQLTGTVTGITLTPAATQADVLRAVALTAMVSDGCGQGVANTQVNFTVLDGGGYLSTMSGFTDPTGKIVVTLTLGPDQGLNDVKAVVPSTPLIAIASVLGINPLLLKDPGAALDKNVVNLGQGEVVLARIYPVTDDPVQVQIFTASGRLVRTLNNYVPMGRNQLIAKWDGRTEDEFLVARGVYLVHVTGGGLKGTTLKVVIK